MTVPRFATKLAGYYAWWRSGQAEQRLGFKNFLVVTLARSEERVRHLREAAQSVSDRGLRMFLFAPEAAYLPPARYAVFDRIWRTAEDDDRHSLLE